MKWKIKIMTPGGLLVGSVEDESLRDRMLAYLQAAVKGESCPETLSFFQGAIGLQVKSNAVIGFSCQEDDELLEKYIGMSVDELKERQ